ncbi:MAG: hypothetical protein ACI9G1_005956, partial [Pirellulaceae bacterium]
SRDHKDQGLSVISVSVDDPDNKDAVLNFLREQGAEFDNLIANKEEGGFDAYNGVPLYQLYDRFGVMRYQFSPTPAGLENGEKLESMEERLKELLAE